MDFPYFIKEHLWMSASNEKALKKIFFSEVEVKPESWLWVES